jgi:hypothetical protein
MAITNLLIKLKPEEVPSFLKGAFFELHAEPKYDDDGVQLNPDTYLGWVHIREDGTIEFGEPGV